MSGAELYHPPRPWSLWSVAALVRTVWQGDGDLLSLLPAAAYKFSSGHLGYSRRSIILFNAPEMVREIMLDADGVFPKSDLMVGALEPLIGQSIFVTDGDKWRRQRAMIDPAFTMMRVGHAFASMQGAVRDYVTRLEDQAQSGEAFSLDLAMSHLTADIICRTVFSTTLKSQVAHDVFEDFLVFERDVAQVEIWRLIVQPAWAEVRQREDVLAACRRIRNHLGELVDTHLGSGQGQYNDIASAVIAARDSETGEPFTREELIDQLGVFFLAGHETTASVLTWVFFILATQRQTLERIRSEVDEVTGGAEVSFEHTKRMPFIRAVFRETLRLYPPITFMPRVALKNTVIGGRKVKRGALVMIAPWTLHRHKRYWQNPDLFDPDRFMGGREKDITDGAYIPFGLGPHTCVGAGFAQVEATLIIAELARRFDFESLDPHKVRPAARLTTRPARQIICRVRRHSD
jgi:cytochrome P450